MMEVNLDIGAALLSPSDIRLVWCRPMKSWKKMNGGSSPLAKAAAAAVWRGQVW